jgi:DNA polymerase-3 subunit gamma/tau
MIVRRNFKTGSNDLNVVYRPFTVDEMLGNETNRKFIEKALDTDKVPHTLLFTGDAGCGKTTAARIIALGLNCETAGVSSKPCLECPTCLSIMSSNSSDIKEINVGQSGGKDYVDAIVRDLPMAPFTARVKVIIFDEAHELTNAAKDLLLKPIENGFDHVYFIFCTNQPEKLRSKKKDAGEAFLDRCTTFNFNRVSTEQLMRLLLNVCEYEGFAHNKDVLSFIAEEVRGVPRNALVWLNKVATEGSWTVSAAKELGGDTSDEENPKIYDLSKALNKGLFKEVLPVYDKITNVPIETIRITVSLYFAACLRKSRNVAEARKFSAVLDVLSTPIYEQGKPAEIKWLNYMFKVTDTIAEHSRRR